jgi:hypothetical protein
MKLRPSIVDSIGLLMAGLATVAVLTEAVALTPLHTECEAISLSETRLETRPCNLLINRPRQPHVPSVLLQ